MNTPNPFKAASRHQRGTTLVELMIAMLLGLVVVAAAAGLFLTNKRVYGSTESLNRIQENNRVAFELMARDLREAGGRPCGQTSRLAIQLINNTQNDQWAEGYRLGLRGGRTSTINGGGFAGMPQPAANTDYIDVFLTNGVETPVVSHASAGGNIEVVDADGFSPGDFALACNTSFSMLFRVTSVDSANNTISRAGGSAGDENCGNDMRWKEHANSTDCTTSGGTPGPVQSPVSGGRYCLKVPAGGGGGACDMSSEEPAVVTQVRAVRWYIGDNGRGGNSLYRGTLEIDGNDVQVTSVEEIAEGIRDMALQYRSADNQGWVNATSAPWPDVGAVKVAFTSEAADGALEGGYVQGVDDERLNRTTTHVVAIRNREAVL